MAGKAKKPVAKPKAKSPVKRKSRVTAKPAVRSKSKPKVTAKKTPKPAVKSKSKPRVKPKPKVTARATPKPAAKSSVKRKKKTRGSSRFEDIKKALILQRGTLLSEAGTVINATTVRVGSCPDLTDQASAESDQAFVLKLKEREQKLLNKIDETLERINQGTYGTCQSCEALIPYPRLKVRPVTTLCIECKTLEEEEEKIRRG
ncbi:MAG TPA: hypothetical protein EYG58_05805 [Nitrospirales bacterium]|nr:hypothetical protein [Nitrospirales bacterium]HIO70044.1 hypothetical protein [Nitrospirales bacterium]